jgi:hypothetical protein
MQRLTLHAIATALMITAAVAQEAEPALIDLAACRIDDAQVRLSFKFESSPCWDTTEPVIGEGTGEPAGASVAIGTVSTAEICTMNIVIAEFDEALAIPAPTNAIEISVTTPEGAVIGSGVAAIAEPGPECPAPTEVADTAAN